MEPSEAVDRLARSVIGAAVDVHGHLRPGFLRSVYEAALVHELGLREIPCRQQVPVAVMYKGTATGTGRLDLFMEDRPITGLKAVESLLPIHNAQLLSYVKAMGIQLGLLINFDVPVLRNGIKHVVLSH